MKIRDVCRKNGFRQDAIGGTLLTEASKKVLDDRNA